MGEHTKFRAQAARANYLGPDRPDVIYSAKEVCRGMAAPTDLHVVALKRMVRYLRSRPRLVFRFDYQSAANIDVYADTDWSLCPMSRRSVWRLRDGGLALVKVLELNAGWGRHEFGRCGILWRRQGSGFQNHLATP